MTDGVEEVVLSSVLDRDGSLQSPTVATTSADGLTKMSASHYGRLLQGRQAATRGFMSAEARPVEPSWGPGPSRDQWRLGTGAMRQADLAHVESTQMTPRCFAGMGGSCLAGAAAKEIWRQCGPGKHAANRRSDSLGA